MTNDFINNIPLTDIIPSGHNRAIGGFDQEKLEQLAASIKDIGVQQPAVVRVVAGGKYELVAGERRWRASAIARVPTLPCVVKELDDETALRIQIIENLQREDIHPLDEADGYARLEKEGHCEVEYIAQQVGRSPTYVYQRLKLLDLISPAKKMLTDGEITVGHAILIARLPKAMQRDAVDLLYEGMTVKEFDRRIQNSLLMALSTATWKLDDAKLSPKAGSCAQCPKRSGAAPLLFEEVGKKDQCLDKECFARKRKLLIEAKTREIENEPHILVKSGYMYGEEIPEGALDSYEWAECKKKDKGAVRALIVSGPEAGRLTWGVSRVTATGKRIPTPDEKAARAKERATKAAALELREKLFDGIALATVPEICDDLLREATKEAWWKMSWDAKRLLAQRLGFEKRPAKYGDDRYEGAFQDWIVGKGRADLETMRIMILYAGNLFIPGSCYLRLDESFKTAAAAAGIDVTKEIETIAAARKLAPEEFEVPEEATRWTRDGVYGVVDDDTESPEYGVCRVCGCTDDDCEQCIEKTGEPCHWLDDTHTLCSACAPAAAVEIEEDHDA